MLAVSEGRYELLGGSADLHAGQLIDRIGVKLGLPFPAGPELEKLAMQERAQARLSASLHGLECHFSGAETKALLMARQSMTEPQAHRALQRYAMDRGIKMTAAAEEFLRKAAD